MQKFFPENKLLGFSPEKQIKILYDLACLIESGSEKQFAKNLAKLKRYHENLALSTSEHIQKLNKEFKKVKARDYQFQIYLMTLERLQGCSKKDYQMLIRQVDSCEKSQMPLPVVCLLDSIRSAHNIGAIFRNSECFHIEKIILTGLSPTPNLPQVQKTAMGTDKTQPWEYCQSAIKALDELKEKNYTIWAVETGRDSTPITDIVEPKGKLVLIFGHEIYGVSLDLLKRSDHIVHIPLRGQKNSLNVSIAQGIVLHHLSYRYLV